MTMWKKSLIALGLVGSMVLGPFACGGGFSCDDKGRCPNDTERSKAEIDQCNILFKEPKCGAKFEALGACEADQPPSCGPDGKTQSVESPACKMQHDEYTTCLNSGPLDGGGGG